MPGGVRKVSDCVRKVSDGYKKVSDGEGKVSDDGGKVSKTSLDPQGDNQGQGLYKNMQHFGCQNGYIINLYQPLERECQPPW